jgi:hypothetical protein
MMVLVLLLALPAAAELVNRYSFIPSSDPLDPNVIDSVGGKHGVPMGTAAQVNGELVLDGSGHVELPATVLGDYTSASIEAWFYYPSGNGWSRLLISATRLTAAAAILCFAPRQARAIYGWPFRREDFPVGLSANR